MSDLQICRICLIKDVRGYKMDQYHLRQCYEQIVRAKVNDREGLPLWFCYECSSMLHKFETFKDRCMRGQTTLRQMLWSQGITYDTVGIINRFSENLVSPVCIIMTNKRVRTYLFKQRSSSKKDNSNTFRETKFENVTLPFEEEKLFTSVNPLDKEETEQKEEEKPPEKDGHDYEMDTAADTIDSDEDDNLFLSEHKLAKTVPDPNNDIDLDNIMNKIISNEVEPEPEPPKPKNGKKPVKKGYRNVYSILIPKTAADKPKAKKFETIKRDMNLDHWKKINMTEEEAMLEMKQRANSDKFLKANFKCHECYKEFSNLDMLMRHAKQYHDEISYKSVAAINRYNENLTSSLEMVRISKRVYTTTLKHKHITIEPEVLLISEPIEVTRSNECFEISNSENTNDKNITIDERITNHDLGNTNIEVKNTKNDVDEDDYSYDLDSPLSSDDEKPIDEVKDNIHKTNVKIIAESLFIDPVKTEITASKTNNLENVIKDNPDNINSNLKDSHYDSDSNCDMTEFGDNQLSDDESLLVIAKKRGQAKSRTNTVSTKTKQKQRAKKSNDKEVLLKNTRPKKHVVNPEFWKKTNLSEDEAIREFKRREFSDYYLKAMFKCQDCFKGFSRSEMLERHLKLRHDESCGNMVCRFCCMRFRLKHQLVKHIKEHLIIYNCLVCNLQCSRLASAITHQERHIGVKKTCKHCGKEFSHLSTYYTHVRMSHRSAHVCVACGASFVSELGLQQHVKRKHFDNAQLKEEIQKRREESNETEASPTKIPEAVQPKVETSVQSNDAEEIYCAKCDIQFMSRRAYNLHFFKSDNHDDGDAFAALKGTGHRSRPKIPTSCEHCDKDFPSRQAYKKHHLAEHSHIPLYIPDARDICEICGASVQASGIQYHMKSHTGSREFKCAAPDCNMLFTLKGNMQRHYNIKHLGIQYPKYIRKNPGKRKKKSEEYLDNDFSPLVRTRSGYFI